MTDQLVPVNAQTAIDSYIPSSYSTISIDNAETRKTVLNAMNNALSLAEHDGPIEVVGVMCKPGTNRRQEPDGTVTVTPCTDSILVCSDGTAYFTKSEGIRRCLDAFQALGLFEDGEAVPMRVESRTVGSRTIKSLVLI